jgi:bacteriocin-like protein
METNRVLSRVGARLLNDEELQQIVGGFSTGACVWDPIACKPSSGACRKFPPACGRE